MNKVKEPSDFWYYNGHTRLWKNYDEWFWLVAKSYISTEDKK